MRFKAYNYSRQLCTWLTPSTSRFTGPRSCQDQKEEIFYAEGGETLAQVAQRSGRWPIAGNIPGQVGRGSEQPGPAEDVPAHGRGVGLDGL